MQVLVLWISVGLRVMTARLALIVTLAMVFGLFCWALYWPTWERITCVALFAVLVYWPIVMTDRNQSANRQIVDPKENQDG